jgi:hypothetical protein
MVWQADLAGGKAAAVVMAPLFGMLVIPFVLSLGYPWLGAALALAAIGVVIGIRWWALCRPQKPTAAPTVSTPLPGEVDPYFSLPKAKKATTDVLGSLVPYVIGVAIPGLPALLAAAVWYIIQ